MLRANSKRGPQTQPWQLLSPIANLPDPIHFTVEEMALLLAQANDKVFHDAMGFDEQHNTMLGTMRAFQTRRDALNRRLEPYRVIDRIEADRVEARFPAEVIRNFTPDMIELNSLVSHLRDSLPKDTRDARRATNAVQTLFRKNLGIKFKIQVNDPAARENPAPEDTA